MIYGIGAAGAAPTAAASGLGGMDSQAFLQLLVAQLRFQNPMEPTDATAMMQQTAQFTQVETLQQLATVQQQLLGLSHAQIGADLVGKHIVARGPDDTTVEGLVEAVRFTEDGPLLTVGDWQVPLEAAIEVRQPASESETA